ncbi:transmembrane protein 39A isoform X1 [Microplitis demolitor]|uniref:transmembrane protein 39A isoform X1 n=1 Tax=Microplitis demolitor TaxID=69319 RepID=UPI00044003D2|nr:transmembrane protein 39A isoform X1 [Microplitis demolitor]
MPSARRNSNRNFNGRVPLNIYQVPPSQSLSTTVTTNVTSNVSTNSSSLNDDKKYNDNVNKLLAPKHVPIPTVPVDEQLIFEAISLGISVIAACLQLLNLYRTVWWLPQSYNDNSMNFYLIDPYLIIFIITMITRRFVYALLRRLVDSISPVRWIPMSQKVMRIILLVITLAILIFCLYLISQRHNSMKVFYLCYPSISVYFFMFGVSIDPFFDITSAPLYIKEDRKTKFLLDKPLHNCSLNASAIRAEVSSLRYDFNCRLKRALFASSGSAYVCGIAPIIFVPQYLHFNMSWIIQHIVLFWLGRLSAHFAQAYPVRYCDVLHRAALHLGKWSKIDSRNVHLAAQSWNDSTLWPHGSIVKHNKEFYRSNGLCTAAEPGNSSHYRFYTLFNNPTMLLCSLLGLQLLLVSVQLLILLRAVEWYQILSMTLLLITNYYTLFKLARDFLVCWKVYRAEKIIQEKAQTAINTNQ